MQRSAQTRSSGSIQRRKQFTIYDVPVGVKNNKNATPYGMAVGGDGNILVRGECIRPDRAPLDRTTGKFDEYPLMMAETDVRRIDLDPTNPNRVWYSGVSRAV